MRTFRRVYVIGITLTLAACSSGGSSNPATASTPFTTVTVSPSGVPSSTTTVAAAADAIYGFDERPGALARSLTALTDIALADPAAARRAALGRIYSLDDPDPTTKFAAVYALTLSADTDDPESIDVLRRLAASPNLTERLLAAGALAALGDTTGIPVLIDALTDDHPLRNVDPPTPSWRYARANLLLLTGQDLGLRNASDIATARSAQAGWQAWWTAHGNEVVWNPELGRYGG